MPNAKVTQVVAEVAIEPGDRAAQVAQRNINVAILPDGYIRISQDVIELLHNLPPTITWGGSLSFQGTFDLSVGPSPTIEWFDLRKKKPIYLVTIILRYASGSSVLTETLYLGNHPYNTKPDEDPPNVEFRTLLRDEGVPALTQEMSEVFSGLSVPTYGRLMINNADGELDEHLPPNRVWTGGDIEIKLVGDRSEMELSDGVIIMKGILGRPKWSDNTIEAEIFSTKRALEKKTVAQETFIGPSGEEIIIPELYGYGYNISPILKDEVDLVYKVASTLTAIDVVYDSGVALSASQYSLNVASGEFTLNQSPAGQVTVDARGRAINGAFSAKRGDFIYDMLVTFGEVPSLDIDSGSFQQFNELVPGDSGIYLTSETNINQAIESLLRPVLGYLAFSRTGIATIGRLALPSPTGSVTVELDNSNIIADSSGSDSALAGNIVSTEMIDLLYYKVILRYGQNHTVMDVNSIGDADPIDSSTPEGMARREWLTKEWREAIIEPTGPTIGVNLYVTSGVLGPMDSYFVNKADADNAAQYWLDIFGVERRLVTVRCKITPLRSTLHETFELSYRWTDPDKNGHRWYNGWRGRSVIYREDYGRNMIEVGLFGP